MRKIVAAALALPVLWLGWAIYDNSVKWGTSDPCEMVAERLRQQEVRFDPEDPLDLNAGWYRSQLTGSIRDDGAPRLVFAVKQTSGGRRPG